MISRDRVDLFASALGAAGIGLIAGMTAMVAAFATGSEVVALLVAAGVPAAGVRLAYPTLPIRQRVALSAMGLIIAAAVLLAALSSYTS